MDTLNSRIIRLHDYRPSNPTYADRSKIVSFGASVFAEAHAKALDSPSITLRKAHLQMSELDNAAREVDLVITGTVVMKTWL
jgi:hypothetical protein